MDEKKKLRNKKQLEYYYKNKQIYKTYQEKNKRKIKKYNYDYNHYNNEDAFKIVRGIFVVDFD